MIVWLNGTHGVGKTTTSALVQGLLPDARVLHADEDVLRDRIRNDAVLGPSTFRFAHVEQYAEAARAWLHEAAEVIDTTRITAQEAAQRIAHAVAEVSAGGESR